MSRPGILATLFFVLLIGLSTVGYLMPSGLNWGFHFWGFLPSWYFGIYLLLAGVLLALLLRTRKLTVIDSLSLFMERSPGKFLFTSILVFFATAIVFQIKAPLWGDGFFIVKNFSDVLKQTSPLYVRNEPLATYYYFFILKLFNPTSYEMFLRAYWYASVLTGIGFVSIAFLLVRTLFRTKETRLYSFLLVCSGAYMELFFGYVETYSIVVVLVLLFVWLSLRSLEGTTSFPWVALSFFFMGVSHYLTVLLFPSLVYVAYRDWKINRFKNIIAGTSIIALGILLTLWLGDFNIDNLTAAEPHEHSLSVSQKADRFESESSAYTLFSPYHFLDLLNYLVMIASAGTFLLLVSCARECRSVLKIPIARFFLVALLPVGLFLFFVKFDMGMAKDWDVLTPFFSLLVLFGFYLYTSQSKPTPINFIPVLIGMTLLQSMGWFLINTNVSACEKRARLLLDTRNVSLLGHYMSSLHLAMFYHQTKNDTPAISLWKEFYQKFPHDQRGYKNALTNLKLINPTDYEAQKEVFEAWNTAGIMDTTSRNEYAAFSVDAGNYYFNTNALENAKAFYRRASDMNPASSRAYNNLGSVYAMQDSTQLAIKNFNRAIGLDSTYSDAYFNLGSILSETGKSTDARSLFQKAAGLGNEAAREALNGIK